MTFKDLKIISFIPCDRKLLRKDTLSKHEVFCGPNCITVKNPQGYETLQTPLGLYDIQEIAKTLPESQYPELIIVHSDNNEQNMPRNLGYFKVPKVLVLGENAEITKTLKYAQEEQFDFICSENNREVLSFYKDAGFENTFWSPALNFRRFSQPVRLSPLNKIVYNGTVGELNSYSFKCLNALQKNGIAVNISNCNPEEAAALYSKSLVSLNCSSNGEINNKVYEVLASGGFLLTDRLSGNSGLEILFQNESHLKTFSSSGELVEAAKFYLKNQQDAISISRSGLKQFNKILSYEKCASRFLNFIFNKEIEEPFQIKPRAKTTTNCTNIYETLKKIQFEKPGLKVSLSENLKKILADKVQSLHRLTFNNSQSTELLAVETNDIEGIELKAQFEKQPFEELIILNEEGPLDETISIKLKKFGLKKTGIYPNHFELKSILKTAIKLSPHLFESLVLQLDSKGKLGNKPLLELAEKALIQNKETKAEIIATKILSRDRSCRGALEIIYKIKKKVPGDLNLILNHTELRTGLTEYPMKILLVTNLYPPQELGEYGRLLSGMAKVLFERGHQVYILSTNQAQFGDVPARERGVFRSLNLSGGWQNGETFSLSEVRTKNIQSKNLATLRTHIRAFTPDVCLLGDIEFLGFGILRELLNHQIPVIHYIGNSDPGFKAEEHPQSPLYFKALASKALLIEFGRKAYSLDHTDIASAGALVDFYNFEKEPSFDKLKIAFIGSILPENGAHLLINSLAALKNHGIDFECEIAGNRTDENYLKQLKAFLISQGLSRKVLFSTNKGRPNIREVLARSNTLVCANISEKNLGIIQVEAMAAGLTVISSAKGPAQDIIDDGVNGLLFNPKDNQTLTAKLLLLAQNKKMAKALAKQGQFDAVNEYNLIDSVRKLEEDFKYLKQFSEPMFLK